MLSKVWRRADLLAWQFIFLIVGTSWLWASHLNTILTYRTTLISQYETPGQPYDWLFRLGDFIAGLLVLVIAAYLIKRGTKIYGWLLLALSIGMMGDPLLSTTCRMIGDSCQEYFSTAYLLHAIETVYTSSLFFVIAVYDAWKRKRLVSICFAIFQVGYGLLFVSQLADQDHFNTISQYVYQTSLIVWLAWFCRDLLAGKIYAVSQWEEQFVRRLVAAWAFINGILAIVLSLAHLNLLGRIKGIYFSGDTAWLAQHGVIVGVIMIYLARHLARGEARARQIFLLLTGVEVLKYSLVSPHAGLLAFYSLTFAGLFLLRDDFDRGSLPLTWHIRLRDLYFLVSGLLLSAVISLLALDRDSRASIITVSAINHFNDYVFRGRPVPHRHINSVLLAHSLSVFIAVGILAILWVLFRPYKFSMRRNRQDFTNAETVLKRFSDSSEDFFKLWPADKHYFWGDESQGFIAYKIVGTVAFGLANPIGPNRAKLVEEFNTWCRQRRLKICYLPVYPASLSSYEKAGLEPLQIGSSAIIDIKQFLAETIKDKWWRWRINRAGKNGYQYELARPSHPAGLLKEMRKLSDIWLSNAGRAERGFALGHFDENYLQKCLVHILRD
ncbi:MAG TPA: phosphatidylglycerol lysyltransferase domain-containing protein, partial [Candidatus Saccharimonadales bacterium]|nr:phosphatidylglycerol lysyltransferase domain-containing protein [Candidatus Saccharimonadales bacterium]